MKKYYRDQIKWKLYNAKSDIEQSLHWLEEDGSNQVPEAHQNQVDSVIAKMKDIEKILNSVKDS